MAFGLVPHYQVVFSIEGMTDTEFLAVIREAAQNIGWRLSHSNIREMVAYTKNNGRSVNERILLTVVDGLVILKSESTGGQFFDMGRNKRNVNQFIKSYDELRFSLTAEELSAKSREIEETEPAAMEPGTDQNSIGITSDENTKGILSIFIPVRGYFVTPVLIDINILLFLLMTVFGVNVFAPTNHSLLHWGANFRPLTLAGEPWRLFTNFFLHIGILHLVFNMYALLYIGVLLEPRLGSWRFGITYLVTGIMASVASVYMHPMIISAGASGAIFGMYGVFLAMLTTNLIEKSQRIALLTSIGVFVAYNLMNGMKGGIDNAAHIGGLVSGILIGYSFYPGLKNPDDRKLNFALPSILMVGLLIFSSWRYRSIPNDIVLYDKGINQFVEIEKKGLHFYRMQQEASYPLSAEILMAEIKDSSLFYWRKNKELVLELDRLEIPQEVHQRNQKLLNYCDLRINIFQLLYQSLKDSTTRYQEEIRGNAHSIDSLISTLK